MKSCLTALLVTFAFLGCSVPGKKSTPAHPAVKVANEILVAMANGDAEGLHEHLNAVNQKKLTVEKIKKYLPEMKRDTGGATEISELVKGRRFDKTGEVAGKIRVVGEEVMILSLTLEDGKYLFEDINSPSVKRYAALGKLWP